MAAGLLILNVAGSMAVGVVAYQWSRDAVARQLHESNLVLSRSVRALAERMLETASFETAEAALSHAWDTIGASRQERHLCFIDPLGRATLNTGAPLADGIQVGDVALGEHGPPTIASLISTRGEWSGENLNPGGIVQAVAFSYSSSLGGLVAVHVPSQAFERELRAGSVPWVLGLGVLSLGLFPLAFATFHAAYRGQWRAARRAEAQGRALSLELERARRLEAVGQLAGGVAHDFNNMLTVILAQGEVLREDLGEPAQREAVDGMMRAARRAADLTSQLLAFGRRQALRPVLLDVRALLEELRDALMRVAGDTIELGVEIADVELLVRADRGKLAEVMSHLVRNARSEVDGSGRIQIRAHRVELGEDEVIQLRPLRAGPHVRIDVSDDGPGMDDATARRVFEPFFSGHPGETGTDLGMAMVHGTIAQSGGCALIRSRPGEGTTVSVILPCVEAPMRARAQTRDTQGRRQARRLLLVEDEEAVRRVLGQALRKQGYEVTTAAHGAEALERAHADPAGPFDGVIADVVMPGMPGTEVVKQLRQLDPRIAVLLISGYTGPVSDELSGSLADHALLHKPFTLQKFLERVREVLSEQSARPTERVETEREADA